MNVHRRFWFSPSTAEMTLLSLTVIALGYGCNSGTNDNFFDPGSAPREAPRMQEARFVDVDQNGVDEGDVILLRFNADVVVQGAEPTAIVSDSDADSFGDDAVLQQSLPNSRFVEIVLGDNAALSPGMLNTPGVTRLNIASGGEGVPEIQGVQDRFRAARTDRSVVLQDVTGAPPSMLEIRYVDGDNNCAVNAGDLIVVGFDKPVMVGATTVAMNFSLPVTGDRFDDGSGDATVSAATDLVSNRVVLIKLGTDPVFTPDGAFDGAAIAPGSPSGLAVAPTPDITDTVGGGTNVIQGGPGDAALSPASPFGNGREAEVVLGNDAFTSALTAQGVHDPAGIDFVSGDLLLDGTQVSVSLLFVADRENDRVLIFESFPAGSSASARWVLGQPDFANATSEDPADPDDPAPNDSNLSGPAGVAFDLNGNRLFVSDTGNHRILVWEELFFLDRGGIDMVNGREATFVLGQGSFRSGLPNRGLSLPSATSLRSPAGLSISGGRFAVADRDNHRVLVFGSVPTAPTAVPGTVLGQGDFQSGQANRGGAVAADTMRSPRDVALFHSSTFTVNGSLSALLVADTANNRTLVFNTDIPPAGAGADAVLGQVDAVSAACGATTSSLCLPAGVLALTDSDAATARAYVADAGNDRIMTFTTFATGNAGVAIGMSGAPSTMTLRSPAGVDVAGTSLVVSDAGFNRVLAYGSAALPAADLPATLVLGQIGFGRSGPDGRRLNRPTDALFVGGRLILADTGNHRILIYDTPPAGGDPDPDVVLGQADLFSTRPDGGGSPSAAALRAPTFLATDGTRLIVADTGNNRVLIWASIPTASGTPADVVLGQSDSTSVEPNAGGGATATTLSAPEGVSVHENQLVVADRENHRVLIYDNLSGLTTGAASSVVLGQFEFTDNMENRGVPVQNNTLSRPRGTLVAGGRLYVADSGNHRVLVWAALPDVSGLNAGGLFGQFDFDTVSLAPASGGSLSSPTAIAMDMEATRLFITDTGNHRVMVWEDVIGDPRDFRANAVYVLGQRNLSSGSPNRGLDTPDRATLRRPRGVFFNGYELLVSDLGNSRLATFR